MSGPVWGIDRGLAEVAVEVLTILIFFALYLRKTLAVVVCMA
jgi:hypothetical protein